MQWKLFASFIDVFPLNSEDDLYIETGPGTLLLQVVYLCNVESMFLRELSLFFNSLRSSDVILQYRYESTFDQVMACCQPLPEPMLTYHHMCFVAFI